MMKSLPVIILIFLFHFSFGQTFNKLTDYNIGSSFDNKEHVVERNGHVYRLLKNKTNQIEVWDFLGDTNEKIYVSPATICSDDFNYWSNYKDNIIFYNNEMIRIENFITGKVIEEMFYDSDTAKLSNSTYFSFNKGVLKIRNYKTIDTIFDIEHNKFGPPLDKYILYRTTNYYYYFERENHNTFLARRKYDSNNVEILSEDLNSDFFRIIDNSFYCQEFNGKMIKVEENDSIQKKFLFKNYLVDIIKTDNDKVLAYGWVGGKNYFYTFDENNLSFIDTISTDAVLGNMSFGFVYYYNDKLIYTTSGVSCYDIVYKLFDLKKNKIISNVDIRGAILSKGIDSLIFSKEQSGWIYDTYVLNLNQLTSKKISIDPITLQYYDRNTFAIKYKDKCYIKNYNKFKGKTYANYIYNGNEVTNSNAYLNSNLGVGKSIMLNDDILYVSDFQKSNKEILILDESENNNLNIHNFSNTITSNIKMYNGKFYYIELHNDKKKHFDLVVFDPEDNKKEILIDNLKTNFIDVFNISIRQNFLVLELNDDPISVGKQYANWKVFDLNKKEILNLSELQIELVSRMFFATEDYYYSRTGPFNNLRNYKISKEDLSDYSNSVEIKSNYKLDISNDTFSYVLNGNIFLCEKHKCKKLDHSVQSDASLRYFLTPNKRYFGFIQNNGKENNHLFIYDRKRNTYNIKKMVDYQVTGSVSLDYIYNDNLYFRNRSNSDSLVLFKYNVKEKLITKLKVYNKQLTYLSINAEEVHVWDIENEKILAFDTSFNEIANVDYSGIERFYTKKSVYKNDSITVLFGNYKKYNSSLFDNGILVYNSEKRKFKEFLGCDTNLLIKDLVVKDNSIYCLIKDEDSGFQIYKMIFNNNPDAIDKIESRKNDLNIYPNPTTDNLMLNKKIDGYHIYSLDGRLIGKSNDKTDNIKVDYLPNGLFFLEAKVNGNSVRLKFVKL